MNIHDAVKIYKPRPTDSHKGTFGKALLCVGSHGMMGAAILSSTSCLRSGVGLCYIWGPSDGLEIAQISVPEAIYIETVESLDSYSAIGVGCGIGRKEVAVDRVDYILKNAKQPLVIDADAINIIAENKWQDRIPENSIITPHKVEFKRVNGAQSNSRAEQIEQAIAFAKRVKSVVVVKGPATAVVDKDGRVDINTTGNSGMATAGSGDVLTGIITGLLSQGYAPYDAARFGVYIHGLAGDIASAERTEESLIARDIVDSISKAYKRVIYG